MVFHLGRPTPYSKTHDTQHIVNKIFLLISSLAYYAKGLFAVPNIRLVISTCQGKTIKLICIFVIDRGQGIHCFSMVYLLAQDIICEWIPRLTCKYQAKLERLASDKHFCLFCPFVSGEEKCSITLTPMVKFIKQFTSVTYSPIKKSCTIHFTHTPMQCFQMCQLILLWP